MSHVQSHEPHPCELSVILPVYNAMPYLPVAVLHMLHQDLHGGCLELVCADDGSKDGSFEFLLELATLMGERSSVHYVDAPPKINPIAPNVNPAFIQALRAEETEDHPSFAQAAIPDDVARLHEKPMQPQDVMASCRPEHRLKVLSYTDRLNRGQGAAMTLCLKNCTSALVAQMESDDERERTDAFHRMISLLRQNPDWDGVSCLTKCIGWERPGMVRYVNWQNELRTPKDMQKGRFIEIPALHQTALFHKSSIFEVTNSVYRDGTTPTCTLDVPVDMFFWLEFFHHGKKCGKVGEVLLGWRQHPRQHTRTHGRLSIDNLRRIKIHFLLRPGGPAHGRAIQVWSVGETLEHWERDMMSHEHPPPSLVKVQWKPGQPVPGMQACPSTCRPVRLFAYGQEKARLRVRASLRDWDDEWDWFVA